MVPTETILLKRFPQKRVLVIKVLGQKVPGEKVPATKPPKTKRFLPNGSQDQKVAVNMVHAKRFPQKGSWGQKVPRAKRFLGPKKAPKTKRFQPNSPIIQ
jgi:hypothetical protein